MRQYFKGYYFKCSIGDETIAFIPALHLGEQRGGKELRSASLQVITKEDTYFIPYPDITFSKGDLKIRIGNSFFSEKGIYLDIETEECKIHGKLKFGKMLSLKYNIMGPFQYLPFMQCKHSVVSMKHQIIGKIAINGRLHEVLDGIGYIEGDSGFSFPEEYMWTQCHFANGSIMLSVAKIPFCGLSFTGIIGAIMIDGKEYRIATYLGAKVSYLGNRMIAVRQGRYLLVAQLLKANAKELKAPVKGKMLRNIQESLCCKARYSFMEGEGTLLEATSESASFEYMY